MQPIKKPRLLNHWKVWGERWDLNPRPSVPQTDALPAELRSPPLRIIELQMPASSVPPHFVPAIVPELLRTVFVDLLRRRAALLAVLDRVCLYTASVLWPLASSPRAAVPPHAPHR